MFLSPARTAELHVYTVRHGLNSPTRIKRCLSFVYPVSDSVSFVGNVMKRLVMLLFGGCMLLVEMPSWAVLCVW